VALHPLAAAQDGVPCPLFQLGVVLLDVVIRPAQVLLDFADEPVRAGSYVGLLVVRVLDDVKQLTVADLGHGLGRGEGARGEEEDRAVAVEGDMHDDAIAGDAGA